VVAYWDQRGTGKPWRTEPSTISLERLVADARAMLDWLGGRLGVDSLDIRGRSLGAALATLAAAWDPARIGHIDHGDISASGGTQSARVARDEAGQWLDRRRGTPRAPSRSMTILYEPMNAFRQS
jgi:pimeloyl-ACP methyl ester carboxylesterase